MASPESDAPIEPWWQGRWQLDLERVEPPPPTDPASDALARTLLAALAPHVTWAFSADAIIRDAPEGRITEPAQLEALSPTEAQFLLTGERRWRLTRTPQGATLQTDRARHPLRPRP